MAILGLALLGGVASAKVLQVGSWNGSSGPYTSIQQAVNEAQPGDWILIGPGVYHEQASANNGVLITTAGLHLRGMDRNGVVVDGTLPGTAGACSNEPAAQLRVDGGRNGIQVLKVDGVTIENLTVCNFLATGEGGGNQIWWNGGDGSGQIGMGSFGGAYLTASSSFFDPVSGAGGFYGLFVSNSRGPGVIERSYASNMVDSAFYVGACPDCNTTLRYVHGQNSALGYSGTNSGGHLLIQDSEWDHNRAGIVPNSLADDDLPSPQDGACPAGGARPCTIIERNFVHDNNNPNTPAAGLTASAPVGTGIQLSGGRNNWVRDNVIQGNGAWGILTNDYPDFSSPQGDGWCSGGQVSYVTPPPYDKILGPTIPCMFLSSGNRIEGNQFQGNGTFGNTTNGDLANVALPNAVNNCFRRNVGSDGGAPSSWPKGLQSAREAGLCGAAWSAGPSQIVPLMLQVLCAAYGPSSGSCLPGPGYPQPTGVELMPIPQEPGMSDPCAGVPANSWCSARR
jgi:hypothetical protein